jgi:hypothetical protein
MFHFSFATVKIVPYGNLGANKRMNALGVINPILLKV